MAATLPQEARVVAALNLATVAVYSDLYITQPILPLLSKEFRISPAEAGLSISVVVLMIAVVSSAYGVLSDVVGRKPVMVVSCALLAVPTALCATATTFHTLLVFRALQGLLMPGLTAVAVAWLGDRYGGADLGPKVGSWIAASVTGGLAGRVLSGLIAAGSSWHVPFVVFGAFTLIGALAMARSLPASPRVKRDVPAAEPRTGTLSHFSNRRLVGAFLIGGCVFFAFIGVFTYLPYYLSAAPFGLSTAFVSSIYLVYVAGVLTSMVVGRLTPRVRAQPLMAAGLLIAGAGILGTLVPSVPVIVVSLVVLCVGMFTVQSTAPAFVNHNALGAKGGAGSLYVSFYYVGATLGSVLPGWAFQHVGWGGVAATCLASLGAALLFDVILCA